MTPRDEAPDPSLPLRRMAEPGTVADALARQVAARWAAFRRHPDAALLDPLEKALRALLSELAAVRALRELGGAASTRELSGGTGDTPETDAPAAEASGPAAAALEDELRRTLALADRLRRQPDASGPDPAAGDERPNGSPERRPARSLGPGPRAATPPPAASAADPEDPGLPWAGGGQGRVQRLQALDGLLYRVLADWQHYRRDPSEERAGLLRGELHQALEQLGSMWDGAVAGASPVLDADGAEGPALLFPPFRDQATGLYSREGFDTAARGELKRCRRHERNFSLLLLQPTAREIAQLREAGAAVRRALRESDVVGRHVDRTLGVALPETSLADAREVARRLLLALRSTDAWEEPDGRVGIAAYPLDGDTLLTLLEAARRQLTQPPQEVLGSAGRATG